MLALNCVRGGAPLNPPFFQCFFNLFQPFCFFLHVGLGGRGTISLGFMIFCLQNKSPSHTLQLLRRNQKQWTNESVTLTVSLDCRTPKKKFQLPLTAAVTVALTVILNGNFCQNETRCTEIYYTLMK